MNPTSPAAAPIAPRWRWLPPMNSPRYYVMLALLGIFILGPLGGVTACGWACRNRRCGS